MRGLQQTSLAEIVGVSPATISQYEAGSIVPSLDTLQRLSVALGVTSEFFERPWRETEVGAPFFRSLRSTPQRELERARSFARLILEVVEVLERDVVFPDPRFDVGLRIDDDASDELVEEAALGVRAAWTVPPGPVAHMVRLVEQHGGVISAVAAFDPRVDAFSMRGSRRPLMVLCSKAGAAARRRFDAAHELGHLIMHERSDGGSRIQEGQAHRFASALLMPAEEIQPWLIRKSSQLDVLEEGSRIWGVSMQALLRRARDLRSISEAQYSRTMQRMSAYGWRTREPVLMGPPEQPQLLSRAVEALAEIGMGVSDVAAEIGLPRERLARMLRIPEDFADAPSGEVIPLHATVGRRETA
jgi:Zn-dependent peptidase ImmA (M78 family)/transcriptional regulator with XRE-family HTH domain